MTEKEFNLPEAIEDIRERGMKIKLKDAPKEFNLSERIKICSDGEHIYYTPEDIKEFIKIIKQDFEDLVKSAGGEPSVLLCNIRDIIDKRAGDKLTKS